VRALVNPGDPFLVDASTYTGTLNLLSAAGARLHGVPSDDDGPELDALERLARSGAKGLYLMPNCHNPTGATISPARREELIAWSRRAGVPLIEDDYAAELHLDGPPSPPAMRALDGDVIYVGTFSKKLIPALRIGFLVAPSALAPRLIALKHAMDLGTSALLQHALAEFLERGWLKPHLGRTIPEYRRRRDALERALRAHMPRSIDWRKPHHGVSLWIPLPAPLDPEAVFDEAQRRGVVVSPGTLSCVALDDRRRPGIRMTFCAESVERVAEGGRRLAHAIHAVAGRDRRPRGARPAPQVGLV
jgi:DNA-binding transcriptional MocR family regulator